MTLRIGCIRATVCSLIALACQTTQPLSPPLNAALVQTCAPFDGPAQAASVTFRGLAADSTVEVTYRLEPTSGRPVTGQGRARLHPAKGMCG